jgi:hypothetical protein
MEGNKNVQVANNPVRTSQFTRDHQEAPYPKAPRPTSTISAQVMHYGPSQQSHHQISHPQVRQPQPPALPITHAPATDPFPSPPRSNSESQSLARAGIWSEADDATLRTARAQSHGWSYIANNFFPGKTGNACRKRHEFLVKKSGGGNDAAKLDLIAKEYMGSRETIWRGLAERTGDGWKDVERLVSIPYTLRGDDEWEYKS